MNRRRKWLSYLTIGLCMSAVRTAEAKKPLLAAMPIESKGVDTATAEALNDALLQALHEIGDYTVLGKSDIEKLIGFQGMRQLLGCTDVNCSASIGNTVGADVLLTATIAEVGQTVLFTVRLLDVKKITIIGSQQERAPTENVNWVQIVRRATYGLFGKSTPEDTASVKAEQEKQQAVSVVEERKTDEDYNNRRRAWAIKVGVMFGLAALFGAGAGITYAFRPSEESIRAGSYQTYLASPPSQANTSYQAVSNDILTSHIMLGAVIGSATLAGIFAAVGIGYLASAPQRTPKVSMGLGKDNFFVQLDASF